MSEIRVRFVRGEEVKFISHLDLMQVFERALRRAHLPIAYSQGFNPHPHMVFGLPLSVGVTSEREYADLTLTGDVDPEVFQKQLNAALPKGFKITGAAVRQGKDNIMASIGGAMYDIAFSAANTLESSDFARYIEDFLSKPELMVKKEGKKGVRDVNIRPMIQELHLSDLHSGEGEASSGIQWLKAYVRAQSEPDLLPPSYSLENLYCLTALLRAGSVANLRPELLFAAFSTFMEQQLTLVKIHRSKLLVNVGGALKDPLEEA